MTTYTEAATASYKQLAKQWRNMELFNDPDISDSFWIAARLWRDQGKVQRAHELLAPAYCWFTEGLDTRDLKEAKALLEKLAA
jgi:predicted ATPase